jgi:hypothetical protein
MYSIFMRALAFDSSTYISLNPNEITLSASGIDLSSSAIQVNPDSVIITSTVTDVNGALTVTGNTSTAGLTMTDPTVWMEGFRKQPFYYTDFLVGTGAANLPWVGAVVGTGGTLSGVALATAEHPGITRLLRGTTSNSGYSFLMYVSAIYGLAGNEMTEAVVYPVALDSVTTRFGFHNPKDLSKGSFIARCPNWNYGLTCKRVFLKCKKTLF